MCELYLVRKNENCRFVIIDQDNFQRLNFRDLIEDYHIKSFRRLISRIYRQSVNRDLRNIEDIITSSIFNK